MLCKQGLQKFFGGKIAERANISPSFETDWFSASPQPAEAPIWIQRQSQSQQGFSETWNREQ
jgi:hypothetical protein